MNARNLETDPWPVERVDLLRTLFAAGAPYSEIAAKTGVSRSAVASKVARLKLAPRGSNRPRPKQKPKLPKWYPPLPERKLKRGCSVMELKDSSCRWPIQDRPIYLFCGHQHIAGSPYCAPHTKQAWRR